MKNFIENKLSFLKFDFYSPFQSKSTKALILALYEDTLKTTFDEYLGILESTLSDPVEKMKIVALEIAKSLLEVQPEQEGRLLAILINKLGDPKSKVVQRSIALLNE